MKVFWTICICFCSIFCRAQDTYNLDKLYSPAELKVDLDVLVQSLQDYHPALYEFMPKPAMDAYIQSLRDELNNEMTEVEFHIIVRKLIKEIGCGHTTGLPSTDWYSYQKKDPKSIPLSVYIIKDALYFKYYQNDSLNALKGREIISINNRKSSKILREMRAIQQRDGYSLSFVNQSISKLFSTYHLFLYGRSESYNLTYKGDNEIKEKIEIEAFIRKKELLDRKNVVYEGKDMSLSYDKTNKDLAILDINSFASKGFKKDYKHIFKELDNKQIKHLVIDLRDNYGGFFPNGNNLLKYILPNKFYMKFSRPKGKPKKNKNIKVPTDIKMTKMLFNFMPDRDKKDPMRNYSIKYRPKKRNHYDGQVYVLTNGGTFSMGGLVTTRLKHDINATIVGTETGGGENGSYAIVKDLLTLPNTKVRVIIPYYFLDHDVTPEQKGMGVMPDIVIEPTIEDLISGKDRAMEAVRNRISDEVK